MRALLMDYGYQGMFIMDLEICTCALILHELHFFR